MGSIELLTWPSAPAVRRMDEDGMSVVAYWPAGHALSGFDRTLGGTVITRGHDRADVEQVFPRYMDQYDKSVDDPDPGLLDTSQPMAAVVAIGDSAESWWDIAAGRYWHATRDDLTDAGRALLDHLDAVCGRPAILITHLDT